MLFTSSGKVSENFIGKLSAIAYWTTGYPLWFISKDLKTILPQDKIREPHQGYLTFHLLALMKKLQVYSDYPSILSLEMNEKILYQPIYKKKILQGILALGPVILPREETDLLPQIPNTQAYANYLLALPQMSPYQYQSFLYLLRTLSTSQVYDSSDIIPIKKDLQPDKNQYQGVSQTIKHHTLSDEAHMIRNLLIDTHDPIHDLTQTMEGLLFPPLADDYLRSEKNRLIGANAIICREAIRLGADSEVTFNLSDHLLFQLETLESVEEVMSYLSIMVSTYRKAIQAGNNRHDRHPVIASIEEDLSKHLSENRSLDFYARRHHMNYQYLSQLFKEHTHMTFKAYVTKIKMEKAKVLLDTSSLSITSIAESLGYTYSNYFTKAFKSYTGSVPTGYKKQRQTYK